jgi:hypothetical protein
MNKPSETHLSTLLLISGSKLGLILVLAFSFGNYANSNQLAKYAQIDSILGGTPKYLPRGTNGVADANNAGSSKAKKGNVLQISTNNLLVPRGPSKDIARLIFISNTSNTKLPNTYYVARSAKKTDTIFYYPCGTIGNVEIAWRGEEKADCDAFAINTTKNSTNKKLSQKEKRPVVAFCSASAESGAWGAAIGDSPWDMISQDDPCREAIRRCEVNADRSPCNVTSLGEKYPKEIGEQWTSVLVCHKDKLLLDNPPRKQDTFSELDDWVRQQANVNSPLNSANCSLHVISADELLVIPDPQQTTAISAGDDLLPPSDLFTIVVLAGKVTLVSPNPNVPTDSLSAGQACYPEGDFGSSLNTGSSSIAQQSPLSQICASSNGNDVGRDLPSGNRQKIYDSPAVRSFLTGWETPEVQQDIDRNYAPQIQQQFLTTTPSNVR